VAGGGTKKLVSCRCRIRFAEEQSVMDGDDWMATVRGYGCGGEGGGSGEFVSRLGSEIQQPPKGEGMSKIVMVER
jgi:hypothetical protein